ncbi:hypothetical protein ABBQ38_009350 [Trebouxia sp. C0009 RCD-2024]
MSTLPGFGFPAGFAAAFGSIRTSQNAEHSDTRYKDLVDDEDHERLTRVLTALEKKDEMQQRMEAITKCNDINMEFKAASMARSVKDKTEHAHASREAFKARGVEHAFALNSQS